MLSPPTPTVPVISGLAPMHCSCLKTTAQSCSRDVRLLWPQTPRSMN